MGSSSKRQMTMAKRTREQAVKERRALKKEKKQAAAAERLAQAAGGTPEAPTLEDETAAAERGDTPLAG